jgi:hypothetical protein
MSDIVLEPAGPPEQVDDAVLSALVSAAPEPKQPPDDEAERAAGDDPPFTLGIPEPRALDLRKVWKAAGRKPDPEILATLGSRVPILLSHRLTAFPRPGRSPARIWGLGYETSIPGSGARTVDVAPTTELLELVKVRQKAKLGLSLGGRLEVPQAALDALSEVPGVDLNDADVEASTDQSADLVISFTLSVPKVISGPDRDGGASWSLYAQDQRIEGPQALLQTLLVPAGTERLAVSVTGWVREASFLFIHRQWRFDTETFDVPVDGIR